MAIAMVEDVESTSLKSYELVSDLFKPGTMWNVSEISRKTNLSKVTVRYVLKALIYNKKIERVGYKQREGYIYAPVAETELLLRIGSEFYTLENLLVKIQTLESPSSVISNEKWNRIKLLILQVVFKDALGLNDETLRDYLENFSNGILELYRFISSLSSVEMWDPEFRARLVGLISSSPVAMNTYADLKEQFTNSGE